MRELPAAAAVERIERLKALDPAVNVYKKALESVFRGPTVRDALHGVWLGHPLHPVLVQVPLGAWVSASVLDMLPGNRAAARRLVGLGVLTFVPVAASGGVDYTDLHPRHQRVGVLHAAANVVAAGLQLGSWRARRRGHQARGVGLSMMALSVGGLGAYLGGHLAFRLAAGANHAEQAPHLLPEELTRLCALEDLPDGEPVRLSVNDMPVFVLRRDRHVDVLYDLCSHLSGPLSDGTLSGAGDELCVTCPWHGSEFRIRDGAVLGGPTTHPQPVLEVAVDPDGTVRVRLAEEG
jgi:nitrite reductase/ring-hydroxylating ferredoxin subunit